LRELLPENQRPARPRSLILAFLTDRILLAFVTLPVEIGLQFALRSHEIRLGLFEVRWTAILIMLAYFAVGDGVFGATPGKWLLRLRVARVGQTGPPGLLRGFLRAGTFVGMGFFIFLVPDLLIEYIGGFAGLSLAVVSFLAGLAAILFQLW